MDPLTAGWVIVVTAAAWTFRPVRARRQEAPLLQAALTHFLTFVRSRLPARTEGRSLEELAVTAELLAVGASAGLGVRASLEAVHRHAPMSSLCIDVVIAELERGSTLDRALREWSNAAPGPTGELIALLRSADRSGVALVDALARFARDLRRRRRRAAERRARRLPVTMLLPLVSCVLPAFGLLTVVPMVAVGLSRVTNHL